MPSLLVCEGLVRCELPAQYYVDFHGCDEVRICEFHLNQWLEWIDETMGGVMFCGDCRQTFSSVPAFLKWRSLDGSE